MKSTEKNHAPESDPEWLRFPKAGQRCPQSNLSRTTLFELTVPCKRNGYRKVVASKLVKTNPHAIRGIRLISRESLAAYLRGLPTFSSSAAHSESPNGNHR